MKKSCLISFFILISISVRADYLITSRSANLSSAATSGSETIEHVGKGVSLKLLNGGKQTNGYYKVIAPNKKEGWIYRTLVRRYTDSVTEPPNTTSPISASLDGGTNDIEITAIDVGAGLSCLIKLPNGKQIIYDGGRASAMTYLRKNIAAKSKIELMILSHTDADHWGAVDNIMQEFEVKKVIRTDYRYGKNSPEYENGLAGIEHATYTVDDYNLGEKGDLQPGKVLYNVDGVKITALCGFKKPLEEWGKLNEAKSNNGVSIVVRLDYKGHSVVFGGDAVGRDDCDSSDNCIATEKFLTEKAGVVLLNADVLIVPHHGADNASCKTFIESVSPEYIVFSAGHMYKHPREATVERYINYGIDPDKTFRTDRGDTEGGQGAECSIEWSDGAGTVSDKSGDDHVRIILPATGKLRVGYLN